MKLQINYAYDGAGIRHRCHPTGRLKKHMDMHMEFSIRFIGNVVNDNPQLVLVTVSQSYCEL